MSGNNKNTNVETTKCKKTHGKPTKKPSCSEPEQVSETKNLPQPNFSLKKTKSVQQSDLVASCEKKKGKGKVYKLNEQLGEENLYTEFKNFTCSGIIEKQYKILTKQICAFLNTQGGKIFIGVDDLGYIRGRIFTKEGKKKFKQTLIKMLARFAPSPQKNAVKIKFHRITNNETGKLIDDQYVVIIKVKKGPIDILFADQNGKSYHRLDGQTRKYLPKECSDELILRKTKQQSLQEYAEKIYNGPESQTNGFSETSKVIKENDFEMNYPENYGVSEGQGYFLDDPIEEAALYTAYSELEDLAMHAYYQAVENQIALEGSLQNPEVWYQDPPVGIENWIPNASMGVFMNFPGESSFSNGFAGQMPFQMQPQFYPQQMMPQPEQNFMLPQAQFVYYQYSNSTMPNTQPQSFINTDTKPNGNQLQQNQQTDLSKNC